MHDHPQPMPMHEGRQLPVFTLREVDLPQVAQWEVNRQYYLVVKVEMVEKHNNKVMEMEKEEAQKVEGAFQIMSIRALDKTPVDIESLERADFEQTVADAKTGRV